MTSVPTPEMAHSTNLRESLLTRLGGFVVAGLELTKGSLYSVTNTVAGLALTAVTQSERPGSSAAIHFGATDSEPHQ